MERPEVQTNLACMPYDCSRAGACWPPSDLGRAVGNANPMASFLSTGPTRFAYVFYAANDPYGCSALVNMARLRRLGGGLPSNVDLVLIASDKLSSSIARAAVERTGALVYNASSFPLHMAAPLGKFADYYRDSVDKFLGFLLPSPCLSPRHPPGCRLPCPAAPSSLV